MSNKSASLGWVTWSSIGLGTWGIGQYVLLAVLARHLTTAEYGVMTATLILIGIGRAIHAGVAPMLVQRQDLTDDHVRSAFALALHAAVLLLAATWFVAPTVADFFAMPQLTPVLRTMGCYFLLQAPGLVPEALLQRRMQMDALARGEIAGVLLGWLPLGIGLAIAGQGVFALVGAYLGHAFVKAAVLVGSCPHRRAVWPLPGATRDLLHYGGGFVAARLCNEVASQGDNFIVGRQLSSALLGIYGRAYQLMAMPAMFLGEVVDRIVFPLLSRSQDDPHRLATAYARGVSLVATLMTPAAAVCIVLAPEIVRVILGPGWGEVTPTFQVLSAGLVFRTGYKISDMLARATGTVYQRAWRQAIFAALIVLGAFLGCAHGLRGVASGIVGALLVNYLMMAQLSLRTTRLGWTEFARLHRRGIALGCIAGAVTAGLAAAARHWFAEPLLVLAAVAFAALTLLAGSVVLLPRHVLGTDALWLLRTLAGRHNSEPTGTHP